MGFFGVLFQIIGWLLLITAAGLLALLTWSKIVENKRAEWQRPLGLASRLLYPEKVDLERYQGKWYEIASLPTSFQRGCVCSTADYTLNANNGTVRVVNRCLLADDDVKQAVAIAWPVNDNNTWLRVNFLTGNRLLADDATEENETTKESGALSWPLSLASGEYWILYVNDDYTEALVGTPDRKMLWMLSRTREISESDFVRLAAIADGKGFDVESLKLTCALVVKDEDTNADNQEPSL